MFKKIEFVLKFVIWIKGYIYLWIDFYDIFFLIVVKVWIFMFFVCFIVKV